MDARYRLDAVDAPAFPSPPLVVDCPLCEQPARATRASVLECDSCGVTVALAPDPGSVAERAAA